MGGKCEEIVLSKWGGPTYFEKQHPKFKIFIFDKLAAPGKFSIIKYI